MTPVDERLLKALAGLRHDGRFQIVTAWLYASLAEQNHKMRRLSGEALIRAQGESLCLERVLEVAGSADEILKT